MQCYQPIKIKNDRYVKTGKVISYLPDYITVPCGRCLACLGQKSSELSMRCEHENIYYGYGHNSCFVTLTYDDKHLPENYSLKIEDTQLFLKRLRINAKRKLKIEDLKYLLVGEYGDKRGRPHYHMILFGLPAGKKTTDFIHSNWKNGHVYVGTCTGESIKYVTKYMSKSRAMSLNRKEYLKKTGRTRPFRTMSHGLGKRWLLDNYGNIKKKDYKISYNGGFYSVPRSYIRWIYKLNLNPDISDDLKLISRKRFIKTLEYLYKRHNVSPEDILKYQFLPEDFRYSLEHYDVFYALWRKDQENLRYSYEAKHELYITKMRLKRKFTPPEIA